MTEMADDEIKIPEAATVGDTNSTPSAPVKAVEPVPAGTLVQAQASSARPEGPTIATSDPISPVPPATNTEQSPFFGKIAPKQPPISLNANAEPLFAEGQTSTPPPTTPLSPTWSAPQKPTMPENTLRAEDKLHSGNIVSLLETRAQKESGVAAPKTGLKYGETPVQRSIREIGLQPRGQTETPKESGKPLETKPGELPRIRTYAADMSEEIRKRGETLATIISAERTKMGRGPIGDETQTKTEQTAQEKTKNVLLSVGAVVLVFIGIVAIVFTFLLTRPKAELPERVSLIPVNYAELVNLGAEDRTVRGLSELRQDTDLRLGEMKEFILTKDGAPLPAESVLSLLGAPSVLARNANSVMVGIHAFDRNQPFILISVSAYDRAFEGMLSWEENIGETLGAFFAPNRGARSTAPTVPPPLVFKDRVYQNIDMRESGAEWKILYAFPRRDLLLITTNESTVREVITRLTLQSGN